MVQESSSDGNFTLGEGGGVNNPEEFDTAAGGGGGFVFNAGRGGTVAIKIVSSILITNFVLKYLIAIQRIAIALQHQSLSCKTTFDSGTKD